MDSFIDRSQDLVFTEAQIKRRIAHLERQQFSARDEEVLSRIASGTALGMYTPTPEEQALMGEFNTFMANMVTYGEQVRADNAFVIEKVAYKQAVARLARYRLAEGREAQYETQETGEYDEQGEPITEEVLVAEAIDPLPATVEQPTYDEEGNQTGTETVPNPLIVQDDAERAEAQAVVDGTSQAVIDFVAGGEQ